MRKLPPLYLLFLGLLLAYCADPSGKDKASTKEMTGESLAQIFCASCHLFPEPSSLDKATWHNYILVRMAAFMGIYEDNRQYFDEIPPQWLEPGIGGHKVQQAKVYPTQAAMSRTDWEKIKKYYLDNAPQKLASNDAALAIKVGIPFFNSQPFNEDKKISGLIQGIGLDELNQKVYTSIYQGGIFELNFNGAIEKYHSDNTYIAQISTQDNQFAILDMGTRLASDNPQGRLLVSKSWEEYTKRKNIFSLEQLMRPVHFSATDLNNDQQTDFVISEYGNLLGSLGWYEAKGDGNFEKHILFNDDGAIKTELLDFNGDGFQDIVALQANADEGIDLYLNDGFGNFIKERLLRFPPTYGSTHFTVTDFNEDGAPDLLVAHGDNGDYTPLLKPYHGVRLYLNQQGKFSESFFLPMNGVYQVEAQDFDLDGDMDIAAVSFHPDFKNKPQESFVLFVNDGSQNFTAYTVPQFDQSRWMRFACTDVDGDQDIDILLTAFNMKTPDIRQDIAQKWKNADLPILLLENTTK